MSPDPIEVYQGGTVSFHHRCLAATSVLLLAACQTSVAQERPAVVDGVFADGRLTDELDRLIAEVPFGEEEQFKVVELGRDANSSHHIVFIRDRESWHRHDRHDLFLVVVRGFGSMLQGDEERPVGEGSVLYIPRGGVHAFRNESAEPAVAYAVFIPAFDGVDRVDAAAGDEGSPE